MKLRDVSRTDLTNRRAVDKTNIKSKPTTVSEHFLSHSNHSHTDMQLIPLEKIRSSRDSVRLSFKTSRVGVYKCLSLIVGFAATVAIWSREVVCCRDFILRAVATFWAMSLVGIYGGPEGSHMQIKNVAAN